MEWGLGGIGHGQSRLRGLLLAPAETQMLFMGDRAVHAGNGERRRRDTGQGVEDFHGPALG